MTIAATGFKVVTEFAFESAVASANVGVLQNQVRKLSDTADEALISMQSLGTSFAFSVSGIGGGILGVLEKAIKSSETFSKLQLGFANIIAGNDEFFEGGETFADRMLVAKDAMSEIVKKSQEFSISANELALFSKNIGAILAPVGLSGTNFGTSTDLSANFLKTTRTLGLDTGSSFGQFQDIVTGNAGGQGRFSRLLFKDAADVFKEFGVDSAKSFNKLFKKDAPKAIEAVNAAMSKLNRNEEELSGVTNLLSSKLLVIKELFVGIGSILKPLGDIVMKPLKIILDTGIKLLKNQGKTIVKSFADFLGPLIESPKKLVEGLLNARSLAGNVKTAAGITSGLTIGATVGGFASKIPVIGSGLSKILGPLTALFGSGFLAFLGNIIAGFNVLLIPLQGLSRALNRSKIEIFEAWVQNSDRLAIAGAKFLTAIKNIIAPFDILIEGWAQLFGLFIPGQEAVHSTVGLIESFVGVVSTVGTVIKTTTDSFMFLVKFVVDMFMPIVDIFVRLGGIFGDILGALGNLVTFDFSGVGNNLDNIFSSFTGFGDTASSNISDIERGVFDFINGLFLGNDKSEESAVAKNVVNQNITMENNFKEVVQPDRIAFTIRDQLSKAATHKAGGQSFLSLFNAAN